jgi:hypothetical protein
MADDNEFASWNRATVFALTVVGLYVSFAIFVPVLVYADSMVLWCHVGLTFAIGMLFYRWSRKVPNPWFIPFAWLVVWIGVTAAWFAGSDLIWHQQELTRVEGIVRRACGGELPPGWTAVRSIPSCYKTTFVCDDKPDEVADFFHAKLSPQRSETVGKGGVLFRHYSLRIFVEPEGDTTIVTAFYIRK